MTVGDVDKEIKHKEARKIAEEERYNKWK